MKAHSLPLLLALLAVFFCVGCASKPSGSTTTEKKTESGAVWVQRY